MHQQLEDSDQGVSCGVTCESLPSETDNDDGYEFQVLGQGPEAAESALAWDKCIKNPGHDGFIPVSHFEMEHMPKNFEDKDWLEFIKVAADLTVRLRVLHTSPSRPENGTFSVGSGNGPVTGTGFIYQVEQTPQIKSPDTGSASTEDQNQRSWDFKINTAAHVVFDSIEAKSTIVDLFYNEEGSRRDGTMRSLNGVTVVGIKQEHDICWLQCTCPDEALATRIISQRQRLAELRNIVTTDPQNTESSTDIIVISHPHGQPKKVTVGKLSQRSRVGPEKSESCDQSGYQGMACEYNAGTCPGSSGAPLIWLGDWWWGEWPKGWVFVAHSMRSKSEGFNTGTGVFYL